MTPRTDDASTLPGSAPPAELLRFMRTMRLPPGETMAAFLTRYDAVMNAVSVPVRAPEVEVVRDEGGWRLRVALWRPATPSGRALVFLHGGGWAGGNHLTHRGLCAEFAARGTLVAAVDYRRAPKHVFPAAYDDTAFVVSWMADNADRLGFDPDRLAVGGDSSGANLAAAVAVGEGRTALRAALLFYGIYDFHTGMEHLQSQVYVPQAQLEEHRGDARLSPLLDARLLPPSYLAVGTADPLIDESRRLRAALEAAGVHHVYDEYQGFPHGYMQLPTMSGYPRAIESANDFLAAALQT